MKILALALLLVVTACTASEQGTPTKDAWLSGPLTFRKVNGEPVATDKPAGSYPAPQARADAPEVVTAKTTRQSPVEAERQKALEAFDCTAADPLVGNDDKALPLVTCDDGEYKYDLGPVFLDGDRIANASAMPNPNGTGHVIMLEFDPVGAQTFGQFTTDNVGSGVAILINGRVLSAPTIQSPILGGVTEISGQFTKDEAEQLAKQLNGR